MLYKPVSVLPDGGSSGLPGSDSATTVTLPGSYYVLQANGTLSSTAVTSINLDNDEGAILVQAETDPPQIMRAATLAASTPNRPATVAASTPSTSGTAPLFVTHTAGAGQVPMAPPAEQSGFAAVLDRIFSFWSAAKTDLDHIFSGLTMAKMEAGFAGSNVPSSAFQPWLGSMGLSKAHDANLPFANSFWEAAGAIAESLSRSSR